MNYDKSDYRQCKIPKADIPTKCTCCGERVLPCDRCKEKSSCDFELNGCIRFDKERKKHA